MKIKEFKQLYKLSYYLSKRMNISLFLFIVSENKFLLFFKIIRNAQIFFTSFKNSVNISFLCIPSRNRI